MRRSRAHGWTWKNEDKLHFGSESVLTKQTRTCEANWKPGSLSAAFLL